VKFKREHGKAHLIQEQPVQRLALELLMNNESSHILKLQRKTKGFAIKSRQSSLPRVRSGDF
jgi:hypothetical protein